MSSKDKIHVRIGEVKNFQEIREVYKRAKKIMDAGYTVHHGKTFEDGVCELVEWIFVGLPGVERDEDLEHSPLFTSESKSEPAQP